MDTDLFLVLGTLLCLLALPSAASAYSEERTPRLASVIFVLGAGLVLLAMTLHPGSYGFSDVPRAFIRVLGRLF